MAGGRSRYSRQSGLINAEAADPLLYQIITSSTNNDSLTLTIGLFCEGNLNLSKIKNDYLGSYLQSIRTL